MFGRRIRKAQEIVNPLPFPFSMIQLAILGRRVEGSAKLSGIDRCRLHGSFRSTADDLLNAQIPDRRQIEFRIVSTLWRKFNILCSLHPPFTIPRSLAVPSQVDCRQRSFCCTVEWVSERAHRRWRCRRQYKRR